MQPAQRVNGAVQIEGDVLVDDDVPESRQRFERLDQIGRKTVVPAEGANGLAIVVEPIATPRGKLAGDVDHELRDHQEREEDVIAKRDVPSSAARPWTRGARSRRCETCRRNSARRSTR